MPSSLASRSMEFRIFNSLFTVLGLYFWDRVFARVLRYITVKFWKSMVGSCCRMVLILEMLP